MSDVIKNQLSIFLDKIYKHGIKEKWVQENLPDLYNFLIGGDGETFSEKVYIFINKDNLNDRCKSCLNKTKFLSIPRGYRDFCSKKCSNSNGELITKKTSNFKLNNIEKWGVDNPMKRDEFVKKLIKKKSELNYSEISEKYKENFIKNWGVDNPSKLTYVKTKKIKTSIENWGVDNPFQSNEIKDKIKLTNIDRFGFNHPLKSDDIKNKVRETLLKNWGVTNPMKSEEIKFKFKETCIEKWGFTHFFKSPKAKLDRKNKMINYHNTYLKDLDLEMLDINESGFSLICSKCKNEFYIYTTTFHIRKRLKENICTTCNPVEYSSSFSEKSILNFIREHYDGEILPNFRINNKEIDIYLPHLKIGFEFNGLYWHSDKFKPKTYHKEKLILFNQNNISCFNIWEDDWADNEIIIKSMILNKLGKTPNRIFGRKCQIMEVDDMKLVRDFLVDNHIQGFVGSKVKLGLFYEDELVSLMTFGNLRRSLGQKSKVGSWELLRFCNKLNTQVVGGASKLFKYFLKNFEVDEIISYSKNDYSNGNLYKKLEFEFIGDTKENYYWVVRGKRIGRFNFRKDKLVRNGEDPNLTEVEIMQERGYHRVFDSGNKKWIYKTI